MANKFFPAPRKKSEEANEKDFVLYNNDDVRHKVLVAIEELERTWSGCFFETEKTGRCRDLSAINVQTNTFNSWDLPVSLLCRPKILGSGWRNRTAGTCTSLMPRLHRRYVAMSQTKCLSCLGDILESVFDTSASYSLLLLLRHVVIIQQQPCSSLASFTLPPSGSQDEH